MERRIAAMESGMGELRCSCEVSVMSSSRCVLLLIAGMAVSLILGCGARQEPSTAKPIAKWVNRTAAGFVGSESCRECHEAISKQYESHPMAHAMIPAAGDELEDLPAGDAGFSPIATRRYRVERREGGEWHHELGLDPNTGEVLYDQAEPIAFTIGSGTRGRSYVLVRDGRFYQSPVSWYAAEAKWDLSPGYRPEGHQRFGREITDRCLRCHCGQPGDIVGGTAEVPVYAEPYVKEFGISCERCHGPGEAHIEFHRGSEKSGSDPIVNPEKLDPARRDDTCNQCHLQGEAQLLRQGRDHDDFRPGDLLGDIWTVFVHGTDVDADGATEAVSHVQQMQSSRCYIESERALGCISCHDPHGGPSEAERVAHYRQSCLKCHETTSPCSEPVAQRVAIVPSDDCTQCHMPRLSANDIPHTTQTDHRVLRRPGQGDGAGPAAAVSIDDWEIFGESELEWTATERQRAVGLVWALAAVADSDLQAARRAIESLTPLLETFPDDAKLREELGICHYLLDEQSRAFELWNEALAIEPGRASVHRTLGMVHFERGSLGKAREHLRQYVEIDPWNVEELFRLSKVEAGLLDDVRALELARRARQLDPSRPDLRDWLSRMEGSSPR